MTDRAVDSWIRKGEELLAAGEWLDGLAWMREVEKKIPPGVAQRRAENIRVRQAVRRLGIETDHVPERVKPLSVDAQIAMGKRSLLTAHVHAGVRSGKFDVEPWPIPRGGWKRGGWKLRLIRRLSPNHLEKRFKISAVTLRNMILAEPAIPHEKRGRVLTIAEDELPLLEVRMKEYRAASRERRRAASRRRWAKTPRTNSTQLSVRALAQRSGISAETAGKLMRKNSDLGWVRLSNHTYLPTGNLEAWDGVVAEWIRVRRPARSHDDTPPLG